MKNLIYKKDTYYITDDVNDSKGKSRILKYKPTPNEMPHKHFNKYIVIYGRHTCPYCIKTVELLKKNPKVLFVEIDVEPKELFGKHNLLEILKSEISNHSTVPIIFDKGIFVGGSNDAEKYF